jgi:RHS repeat-associated protein
VVQHGRARRRRVGWFGSSLITTFAGSKLGAATVFIACGALLVSSTDQGYLGPGGSRGDGRSTRPAHAAPDQRWGSAAGQGHVAGGSGNHTVPASLRSRYPALAQKAAPTPPQNQASVVTPPQPQHAGFDPASSVELAADRDANSRTYENADGTRTTQFSYAPLNYRQADGSWAPVDQTLVPDGSGWRNRADAVGVRLAGRADESPVVRVGLDATHAIAFGLAGAAPAAGQVAGGTITYGNVLPQTDLRFDLGGGGVEQTLVLRSPDAPTSFVFPLALTGLTARQAGGQIVLMDSAGNSRAVLPAGTMSDSAATAAMSTGVSYSLTTSAGRPALTITLDRAWLTDPARRYPVRVDPSVDWSAADSAMVVHGGSSGTGGTQLLVGDQGGSAAATYLKFTGLASRLQNQTIYGAQLQMVNYDAASCSPRPVSVYPVTQSWTAGSGYSYPGPSVGGALATQSFAYGYIGLGQSGSSCPAASVLFDLGAKGRDLVQGWVNGQANNGLALRASATDPQGWKAFGGTGTANPPKLYVTHSPYNAAYAIPNPVPDPPVMQNAPGKVNLTVTNLGAETWTPSSYYLAYRAFDVKTDKLVSQQRAASLPGNLARNAKVTLSATIGAMPPGTYFLDFTMVHVGGPVFTDDQVPPARIVLQVIDIPPVVQDLFPPNGYSAPTLTPELWARAVDIDAPPGSALKFSFDVCEHTDAGTNVNCFSSGDLTTQAWAVPAAKLSWSKAYQWRATVKDASNTVPSDWVNLLTSVPQPDITSHVANAPYGSGGREFDAQVGNFTTAAIDAPVGTVGPSLNVVRTYNSLDPRRDSAFGAGWTTQYDMRLVPDNDGSGNVVVTYSDGEQVRYGKNPDGTFAAPQGRVATLTLSGTTYTLADRGGNSYQFSGTGRLAKITDAGLRSIVLGYDLNTGLLSKATVSNSQTNTAGRALHFAWSAGHISAATTDAVNGAALTWNYTYNGDVLTKVCGPTSACTTYNYASGSHYRSAVLDASPESYYRLGESSGTAAGSEIAVNLGKDAGTYRNPTLAAPGALAGTGDTATTFNGTSSEVDLPKGLLKQTRDGAVELWFKISAIQTGGPLIGYQDQALSGTPTIGQPLVYVGTDGKLRGQYATGSAAPITSAVTVNDNAWHHVVLSGMGSTQTLYLDGAAIGTLAAGADHNLMTFDQIGAAYTNAPASWPGWGTANKRFFSGTIDEVAVYAHPLGAATVAAHKRYGSQAADQLTEVVLPSGNIAAAASYDTALDRVKQYTDHNGGTWKIGAPAVYGGDTDLRRSVQVLDPAGRPYLYEYDALAGRLLRSGVPLGLSTRDEDLPGYPSPSPAPAPSPTPTCTKPDPGDPQFCTILPGNNTDPVFVRQPLDGLAVRSFDYDARGFQNLITGENGDTVKLGYDSRGNVVSRTTCRSSSECHTTYSTFPSTVTNPLDPRNDLPLETRDGRSAGATDNTYRTSYTYTSTGELLTQTNPDGGIVRNTYTTGSEQAVGGGTVPPAMLASTTDPRGALTRYAYFSNGDLAQITEPSGLVVSFTYDALGRKLTETEVSDTYPAGLTKTYSYDAMSRLTATVEPATTDAVSNTPHQRETDQAYDVDGNLTTMTVKDLLGGDPGRVTTYTYDDFGHPAQVTDAEGNVTTYGYDRFGNRTSMVDANGNQYQYAFTARNQLAEVRLRDWNGDPAGTPSPGDYLVLNSYAYDFGGRMVRHTDAMGHQVQYGYYGDDLVQSVTLKNFHNPDGSTRDYVLESDTYDGAGNLVKQVAGNGNRTTQHTITPTGQVASTTVDPTGLARRSTFSYDLAGNIVSTTQSGTGSNVSWALPTVSTTIAYEYDLSGRNTKETAGVGSTTTAVTTSRYDQRGVLVAQTDPRGNVTGADPAAYTTTFANDETGHAVSVTGPTVAAEQGGGAAQSVHPTQTAGYDTFGDLVAQRDELGNVARSTFDRLSRMVSHTGPSYLAPGSMTTLTPTSHRQYDGLGNTTQTTDARGFTTRFSYDRLNRMTTRDQPASTDSERAVWHYTYTRTGDVLSVVDPGGAQSLTTYDDLDRQATVTQAERFPAVDNFTTRYTYDDGGDLVAQTTPTGAVSAMGYDTVGELTNSTDPSGVVTQYGYDFAGRQVRVSDGLGRTSRTDYDPLGRKASESDQSSTGSTLRTVKYGYDAASNLISATDPNNVTTSYTYDAAGQLVNQVEPVSATHSITTSFGYDAAGDRTRYTDGRGNSTIYTTNSLGMPESVIVPATTAQPDAVDRTWTVSYDPNGNAVRLVAPGGVTRQRTYDAAGRLTDEAGSGGQVPATTRTLGYDLGGRVTSVNAPGGTDAYSYNDRGDVLSATGPSGVANFSYDAANNLLSRADAAGTSRYTYTGDRVSTLTDGASGTTQTLTYDASGQVSSVDFGAGRVRSYGYDAFGRLATDTLRNGTGGTVSSIGYDYGANDQITQKTTTGTASATANTYGYDQSGRLTSWTANGSTTQYAWDDSGNRTQAGSETATFDQRDRLLTDGNNSYTYSPRGTVSSRTSAGNTEQYSFDAFDRLVSQGGQSYTYDGLDRAVSRNAGTAFSYDGFAIDPTSDGTQRFARGPDNELLAVAQGQNSQLTLSDQHGDVVGNFAGADTTLSSLAGSTAYDPFGGVVATNGTQQSHLGFQGDWTDPGTGSVDMGARWYDPGTGTFDSQDPQTYLSGDSVLANPYVYGADDPVNNSDPNGNWPHFHCGWCGQVVHAVVSVATTAWNYTYSAVKTAVVAVAHAAVAVYHAARTAITAVAHAVVAGVRAVSHAVSAGINWARQRAAQAAQAAVAMAHQVTAAAKHAVTYAIQHSPLPAIAAAVKPLYAGLKKVVSAAAHLPAAVVSTVRNVVHDVAKSVQVVYQQAVDAAGTVVHAVSVAAQKASEFAQAALPMVAGIAAGLLTTAGCLALTGGAGSAACVVAGFAVGSAVASALSCPPGRSIAGCALRGGAAGLVAGAVFVATGGTGGGISAAIIAGGLSSAAGSAAQQYLDTGHVNATQVAEAGVAGAVLGGAGAKLGGARLGAAAEEAHPSARSGEEGGSCPSNSFSVNTAVLMADGHTEPIKDVKVGDKVMATDPTTSQTAVRTVTALHDNLDSELTDLTVSTGAGMKSVLHTTPHHPMWDVSKNRWVEASSLDIGDRLLAADGSMQIVAAILSFAGPQHMDNLTVDTTHTYYVIAGHAPVLVHNCGGSVGGHKPVCDCANGGTPVGPRNGGLAGSTHPNTGVSFDAEGFPDFSPWRHPNVPDVRIDLAGNRSTDFARANAAAGLSKTPEGYTWHHHQDCGLMQLIETGIHATTGHTGGFSIC